MASSRFSRDDQVLEAIFNPENPVGGLEVSKHIQHSLVRQEWSSVIRFSVVSIIYFGENYLIFVAFCT